MKNPLARSWNVLWSIAANGLQGGRPPQEAEQAQVQRHLEDGEAQLADEGVREGRQAQRRNGALFFFEA